MRIFEVPEGNKAAKGRAIQNLINIEQDDKVKAYVVIKDIKDEEYTSKNYIIMCTKKGIIKKTSLEAYSRPRINGINAIGIREGDELLEAKLTNGESEILMAISSGRAIRFNESKVRSMGRTASGVRGINSWYDEVIGMVCAHDFSRTIMVVSENGYGKRTFLNDPENNEPIYRVTNRGGKGVKTLNVTDKTGNLIAIKSVSDDDDLMIINKSGLTIRMHVADIRTQGRATQGVKLINLKGKDQIAAVAKVEKDDEDIESNGMIEDSNENKPTINITNYKKHLIIGILSIFIFENNAFSQKLQLTEAATEFRNNYNNSWTSIPDSTLRILQISKNKPVLLKAKVAIDESYNKQLTTAFTKPKDLVKMYYYRGAIFRLVDAFKV